MSNAVSINEIQKTAGQYRDLIVDAVVKTGSCPETGFHEYQAAALQCGILREYGFDIAAGAEELSTAFRGDFRQGEDKNLHAAILTEYDALAAPLNHACGHQLIMGAGLMALLITADLMKKYSINGTLCALGCPGEEQLGGKVYMLEKGFFENIDMAVLSHPFFRNGVTRRFLAVDRFEVEFSGRSAHASTAPEQGINALDAITLFMSGINAWRQQLPDSSRVHGIITNGGSAANAIPDFTTGFFYVRSEKQTQQNFMIKRFNDIAHGAALMTGCQYKVIRQYASYGAGRNNHALDCAAEKVMEMLDIVPDKTIWEPFSTDFANVCEKLPGVNIFFDITGGRPVPLHSAEFRDIAASPEALPMMEKAAIIMSKLVLDYFTDKNLQQAVNSR